MDQNADSKAKIKAEIQRHVRAEEAAYRCVERLAVVECITKQEFRHVLNIITISHYNDITEERFVSNMCGYALCANKIPKVLKQKFHISMISNKVYDIAERKQFCSFNCFKASKHVERQIQESPLWLRSPSTEKQITFIDEEKDKAPLVHDCEIKLKERLKLTDDNESDIEESDIKNKNCNHDALEYFTQLDTNQTTHASSPQVSKNGEKHTILISPDKIKQSSKLNTDSVNDDIKMLNELVVTLKDWFTQKSYDFLFNSKKTVVRADSTDVNNKNQADIAITQSFNEKAANFLLRQPEWLSETIVSNKHQLTKSDNESLSTPPLIVDSKSQSVIRKRVVKEKLSSSLRKLLFVVGMTITDLSECGFFSLIDTFRFTSKNIVLKPKQWHNISLVILKLLSNLNHELADSFVKQSIEINELAHKEGLITVDNLSYIVESLKNV